MVRNHKKNLRSRRQTVAATSKETPKASSVAKILNLVDNQKAAAIKDYVRTKVGRQLVTADSEEQNCFSQSVLMQLGKRNQCKIKQEIYILRI